MKSTHTWSLAVSRPRPARKAANRSSTTWWRRIVPSDLPASRNAATTPPDGDPDICLSHENHLCVQ